MRKVVTFLCASLSLTMALVALPATATAQDPTAPDMFRDVDMNHWAYQAVESLRSKGIIVGYPDGYFRGKRTLTRYEFATALDRLLRNMGEPREGRPGERGPEGPRGPQGDRGPQGEVGPPGMTPAEVEALRRLTREFRDELAALGNSVQAVNRKVDGLAREVQELRTRLDNMPRITGGFFAGVRSDRADGAYTDRDGRILTSIGPGSLVNTPIVVHQFNLGVTANIPGGAVFDGMITSNNYKNYVGGNTAQINGLNTNPNSDVYVHHAEVRTPFTGLGRGSNFTIGRFGQKLGRLTMWRPDVDTYFNNPFEDTGDYYIDGARLRTNFGSVAFEIFGGQFKSVQGTNAGPWNSPLAGTAGGLGGTAVFGGQTGGFKPIAQPFQGQMTVDQALGVSAGFGFNLLDRAGHLRLTALGLNNAGIGSPGTGFSNVIVYGADADLRLTERLTFTADWAQSNTGNGQLIRAMAAGNRVNSTQNNAFNATVGFGSGGLNVTAGYRYIDPLFYAPGYWGRIGNWLNPTNIQGPTFRAAYDFTPTLGMTLGGDFFSAARNRSPFSLNTSEDITRALVGLRWGLSRGFEVTADWEGVFWSLNRTRGGGGTGQFHPTEHYITLGTGYNLTANTLLKLTYQIGDFDGRGGLNGGAGTRYNFNTFVGQVAVKF